MKTAIFIILTLILCSYYGKHDDKNDCKSIKIFSGLVDNELQKIMENKSCDTLLLINHCNSTNGCNGWGISYWTENGMPNYQQFTATNQRIRKTKIRNKKITSHLHEFIKTEIWNQTEKIEHQDSVWVNHPPMTKIIFKTTESTWCFNMADLYTLKQECRSDIRVKWVDKLRKIMK